MRTNLSRRVVITGHGCVGPRGVHLPFLDAVGLKLDGIPNLVEQTFSGAPGLTEPDYEHDSLPFHAVGKVPGVPPDMQSAKQWALKAATKRGKRGARLWNRNSMFSLLCARAAGIQSGVTTLDGELRYDPIRVGTHTACDVEEVPYEQSSLISAQQMAASLSQAHVQDSIISVLMSRPTKEMLTHFFLEIFNRTDYIKGIIEGMDSPDWFLKTVSVAPAMMINMNLAIEGPFVNTTNACAASQAAIESAFDAIQNGKIDCAFTGGMWCRTGPNSMAGLAAFGQSSFGTILTPSGPRKNPCPRSEKDRGVIRPAGEVCRPFDCARDGIVPAEGGAMFVLEELQGALKSGAKPLAEIVGFGACTAPTCLVEPNTAAFAKALRLAMNDAQIGPDELANINSHATGTRDGDYSEARAILEALGDEGKRIPVSALKGGSGHHILGSGAAALSATVSGIQRGTAFPCVNLTDPDPACPLNFVREEQPLDESRHYHAILSAGFGGEHAVMIVRDMR